MLITETLAANTRRFGSETALVERRPAENKRAEITWREFDARANKLARALIRLGVNKGDKVALLLTNCLDWLPIYFGILRAGAVAVPLNFRFEADAILRCVETVESAILIFGEEFIERIHRVKPVLDKTVKAYIFTGAEALKPLGALSYRDLLDTGGDLRRKHYDCLASGPLGRGYSYSY